MQDSLLSSHRGLTASEAFGAAMGVAAGVLWGSIYLVPLLLPGYPALLIACMRYSTLLVMAVPFWLWYRREFAHYTRADWLYVLRLGLVGNLVYYFLLAAGVQYAGAPLVSMLMMVIPILVCIVANLRGRRSGKSLPWRRLAPGLILLAGGLVLANLTEFSRVAGSAAGGASFWIGLAFGIASMLCWVWYPIRNADWLLAHPGRKPGAWIAAQCLVLSPIAAVSYVAVWALLPEQPFFGETPWRFLAVMTFSGVVCYALGNGFWNIMSQRLPEALSGQMIIFESLFAVIYAHLLRGEWPSPTLALGMLLMLAGFSLSFRAFYGGRGGAAPAKAA